jgi:hypothetical protein
MRTGIYEPYRNHFPLKQSQVPACQTPRQALPYGAYDPTKAKLVTAGGDYNADGSFTAGEKVVSAVGNGQQRNMSQKIAAAQNYEMFDWRQSNQSLTQENELKCHLIALAIDYSPWSPVEHIALLYATAF